MKTPLRHHNHYHRDTGVPFEQCLRCRTDKRVCEKKIRFTGWEEAQEWVHEYNVSNRWAPPVMTRYRCRWCEGWHMKRAKAKHERARAERQRRKYLVEMAEADEAAFIQWVRTGQVPRSTPDHAPAGSYPQHAAG